MEWIVQILVQSVAVFLAARFLPFVEVKNFKTSVVVAVAISIVGAIIGFFLLPFSIMTLGLFSLVGYVVTVMLVDQFMEDFKVGGIINVAIFGVVVWGISLGLQSVLKLVF